MDLLQIDIKKSPGSGELITQIPKKCNIKIILKCPIKSERIRIDFIVSVNNDGNGSHVCRIPKPIIEQLESPDRMKFVLLENKIVIDMD